MNHPYLVVLFLLGNTFLLSALIMLNRNTNSPKANPRFLALPLLGIIRKLVRPYERSITHYKRTFIAPSSLTLATNCSKCKGLEEK